MDDALVHNFTVTGYVCKDAVLILVVMDDALVLAGILPISVRYRGLNPCCNG